VSDWHDSLGEPTIADAILDRLATTPTASNSTAIRYDGPICDPSHSACPDPTRARPRLL